MIELGALRALRSVAALGTLARAADELGFTASAVSQQLKRLETQGGAAVPAPAQAAGTPGRRAGARAGGTRGRADAGRAGHRRLGAGGVPGAGAVRRSGPVGLGGRAARDAAGGGVLDRDPRP